MAVLTLADLGLRGAAARGLRWSLGARFAVQLIQWSATLVIIRLLEPADYGLMAMATAAISWSATTSDLGLTASVIRSALDPPAMAALQTAILLFNCSLCAIIILVAPDISEYYGTDITDLLRLLAISFAVASFGRIQEAILIREMKFRARSVIESVTSLLEAVTAVSLALHGFGVWALAIGSIVHTTSRSAWYSIAVGKVMFPSARLGLAWPHVRFGFTIILARSLNWLVNNVDIVVLGRAQTAPILGLYNVGKNLALLPVAKLGSTLSPLGFSVYARLADDRERRRAALLESLGMIIVVTVPVATMISALAPEIQSVLLGPKWAGAEVTLTVMSFAIPMILMSSQTNILLMATGLMRPVVSNQLVSLAVLSAAVGVGSCWGLIGAATGWSLGYAAGWSLAVARTCRYTRVGFSNLLALSWGTLTSAGTAYLATIVVRHFANEIFTPIVLLALLGTIGGVTYLGMLAFVDRRSLLRVIAFLRA